MRRNYFLFIFLIYLNVLYATDLKLIWWNVRNFFDMSDDLKSDDTVLTNDEYNLKRQLLSDKIKSFNADIVTLGEIENVFVLNDIASETGFPYYYLEDGNDPRGIDVGVLSKYELKYKSNKDMIVPYEGNKRYKFSRDCPEALLEIDNKSLYLLPVHLKSGYNDDGNSERKRVAQVFGILDIISALYEARNDEPYIILLGDFNSNRYTEPMNILEKSGLVILNYFYKKNEVFTVKYGGKKEDIDYVIFNKKLFKESKIKRFKVFNDDKSFNKISDHYPILFEISF